jgi:Flp pilus assembly protein TadG
MQNRERVHNRRSRQRGNAGVEGALVILPFLVLILGIVNLGVAFFLNDMLHDRVRVAARYASLHPENAATIQNMVLYGSPTAPQPSAPANSPGTDADAQASTSAEPFLGLTQSNVYVVRMGVGTEFERISVVVSSYQLPFFVPGFVHYVVGGPVIATVAVEVM